MVLDGAQFLVIPSFGSRSATQERFPDLAMPGLSGSIVYQDAQMDDARHTLTLARTAQAHGAVLASSVRQLDFLDRDGRVQRRLGGEGPRGQKMRKEKRKLEKELADLEALGKDRLYQKQSKAILARSPPPRAQPSPPPGGKRLHRRMVANGGRTARAPARARGPSRRGPEQETEMDRRWRADKARHRASRDDMLALKEAFPVSRTLSNTTEMGSDWSPAPAATTAAAAAAPAPAPAPAGYVRPGYENFRL